MAPCGSAEATAKTVENTRRYTCQGGGPALGALYGAVNLAARLRTLEPRARW